MTAKGLFWHSSAIMLRFFRSLILVIILVAVVAGVFLWVARVPTLERFLSKRLNTKLTIEEVHFGWGTLTIEGLRIKNPAKSTLPYAFQGGSITLEMSPFQLWSEVMHIDRIQIESPTLGVELYNSAGTDNNWSRLLNTFPSGNGRKFVIKKLTISNLRFDIVRSNGKPINIAPIPYLEFDNLGEKGALTLSQVGKVIFQTLLQTLTSQSQLRGILDTVQALPKQVLEGVKSTLPLENAKGALQEGLDTIKRKGEEASEFLQDLFSSQ